MSLIENVGGIEAARKIVEGALDGATHLAPYGGYVKIIGADADEFPSFTPIDDLRSAIAEHESQELAEFILRADAGYEPAGAAEFAERIVAFNRECEAVGQATVAEVPVQDITDSQQLDAFLDQCRWMVIDGTRDERGWFTDLRTQMCWHFWTKALQLKDHGHD